MTIKMEFTFPNGMKKKVGRLPYPFKRKLNYFFFIDLPYTPQAMKDSRMHCVNRIGKPVYLDDLKTEHQNKVRSNDSDYYMRDYFLRWGGGDL